MKLTKKQEYDLMKRYLSNSHSLKAFITEQGLEWANKVYERLSEIIILLEKDAESERLEAQENERKRLALLNQIEAEGWTLEELMKGKGKAKKKAEKKAAKYCFTDEQGNVKYWSGFGVKPKALVRLLESGRKLEEFLIEQQA